MKSSIALLAVASAFCLAPAQAQTLAQVRGGDIAIHSQRISYGDLDLTRAEGRSLLDRRIDIAVRSVCGAASSADIAGQNAARRCREMLKQRAMVIRHEAIANAMMQASAPKLAVTAR